MEIYETSYDVGRIIGEKGWVLICGGLGGVMEGAAKGCLERGGMTVGLLPGTQRESAALVPGVTLMESITFKPPSRQLHEQAHI